MSESASQPAQLDTRPPKGTQAYQWAQFGTGGLFFVSGQGASTGGSYAGAMVMEVEALLVPAVVPAGPVPPSYSVTTCDLGNVYCLGLAADAWVPQGVNYTT